MKKEIDEILQKRMDRKEFLKHVGMGVAVITGTAGVVKLLKPEQKTEQQQGIAMGYGSSVYGGVKATAQKS